MIVLSLVMALGLLVLLFLGGITGFIFYSIGTSDAAETARTFLKNNERLKQDIGEVKEFGAIVTGNVNVQDSQGFANLKLKVIGARRTVTARVELVYQNRKPWRVTAASYNNEAGETIELLNVYESRFEGFRLEISDRRFQVEDRRRSQITDLSSQIRQFHPYYMNKITAYSLNPDRVKLKREPSISTWI